MAIQEVDAYHKEDNLYPSFKGHFRTETYDFAFGDGWIDILIQEPTQNFDSLETAIDVAFREAPIDVPEYRGVAYHLDCATVTTDTQFAERAASYLNKPKDNIPSFWWAAHYKPNREYIGATHRPEERLQEHTGSYWADYDGALFTKIFEPDEVISITLCIDVDPFAVESRLYEYWSSDKPHDDTFVYQA